jgi:hypothetical protein
MVNILDILEEAATTVGMFFFNGLPSYQNLQGGKESNVQPLCYLGEPLVSKHEFSESGGNSIYAEWPLEFHILEYSDLEFTQQQHDIIIARMRSKALEFIRQLNVQVIPEDGRDVFSGINSIEIENVINLYADNFSGVKLSLVAIPLMPESVC